MQAFTRSLADEVSAAAAAGVPATDICVDLGTARVRDLLARSLPGVFGAVKAQRPSIRKAWDVCGFAESWTAGACEVRWAGNGQAQAGMRRLQNACHLMPGAPLRFHRRRQWRC